MELDASASPAHLQVPARTGRATIQAARPTRVIVVAAVTLLAAAHLGLALVQIPNHSPAADEMLHIASGHQLWQRGDTMDPTHPHLPRYLLTLPLLVLRPDPVSHERRTGNDALAEFVLHNRVPMAQLLGSTRAMAALISLALVLACWAWARRLWGEGAGLVCLALAATSPLVLADAAVVGNDVACALSVLLCVAAFGVYLRQPTPRSLAWFGLAFFVAQSTKFSAVLLGPILLALYLAKRWLERRGGSPVSAPRGRRALRDGALVAAGAGLLLFASYRFELTSLASDPVLTQHEKAAQIQRALAKVPRFVTETRVPAYTYWKGLAIQAFHAGNQATWTGGNNHQFLYGSNSLDGWWYYFPLAMAVKTPLALVVLLAWAAVAYWQRRKPAHGDRSGARGDRIDARTDRIGARTDAFDLALLVIPPVVWLGCCMLLTINIGIRYVLPVYAFACIAVGGLWRIARGSRPALTALALLCAWNAASLARSMPHAHAHFNELAGGPAGGWRFLNNSSIDWGQDLPALARYLTDHAIEAPYLDYFGGLDPKDWGIHYRRLPDDPAEQSRLTGIVVVSQTHLTAEARREPLYTRLRQTKPIAQLGFTLFVYRL